jgi:uncharacterized protein YhbP (UPF0306 family)
MKELTEFLQQQTIMQIAPKSSEPWIANVLMVCEEPKQLFFVGSTERRYGQLLLQDGTVAFATAWHDAKNHINRKGVQGLGIARIASSDEEVKLALALHNRDYPEFQAVYNPEWINENPHNVRVWVIEPTYIKFWNDELYGRDGTETFTFTPQ